MKLTRRTIEASIRKNPPRRAKDFWITGAVVCSLDKNRTISRKNLRIVDGKIAEITKNSPSSRSKAPVLDAHGLTLFPGLIQCHLHLCQTLFRHLAENLELLDWLKKRVFPLESAHTYETLFCSSLVGISELLRSGTTTILDMGTVNHTDAIFEAARITGIRANIGKCLMDSKSLNPTYLRDSSTKAALDEAERLFSKWHGTSGDRLHVSYAPRFLPSCTEELIREVARRSQEKNVLIHTHASENQSEIELVQKLFGAENIQTFKNLELTSPRLVIAHGIWLSEHEKKILRESKASITHCPSSNCKLASGIAQVPELLQEGINVALGADGTACSGGISGLQEMRLAALLHKPFWGPQAMSATTVLEMATLRGAEALGLSSEIGSLEIGKKADLFGAQLRSSDNLVPFSRELDYETLAASLVYSSGPGHIRWTMVDGAIVTKNGQLPGIKEETLVSLALASQKQLFKRAPLPHSFLKA